ncbi:unnamed protein product [Trifolium pratense]|uniref:Uncharacterized protein n=1 Tax=Trifolium pratense TaxID=57577 RepID=A0ACB0KG75_TRIPR|nr:unnamed protein product [Trifolium pratense]
MPEKTGEDWQTIAYVPELKLIAKEKLIHFRNDFAEWKMEVDLWHRHDEGYYGDSFRFI